MQGIMPMLGQLMSSKETVKSVQNSLNRLIKKIELDDKLTLTFSDGSELSLWDDGQSCCESRYLHTDDDLSYYSDSTLLEISLENAPEVESPEVESEEVHEVQFLHIKTSKGSFTIETHNEHNGYYGGFYVKAELKEVVGL